MKKQIVRVILLLILILAAMSMYSCRKEEPAKEHEHFFKTYVSNNDALPGKNGTKTAVCERCGEARTITDEGSALPYTSGLKYELSEDGGSYTVSSVGTAKDSIVVIPYEFKGLPVLSIGESAFRDNKTAVTVQIPAIVTDIGARAFYNCTQLEEIVLPDGIERINEEAFRGCSSLVSVSLPKSLKSIGNYAFFSCTRLISITIPASVTEIEEYSFWGCYKLFEVCNESALSIKPADGGNGYAGFYAMNIYTPSEGESKTGADQNGFVFFDDGDTVYLIGYIGEETELVLPEKHNGRDYAVYSLAFSGCTEITSLTVLGGVKAIGSSAFLGCTGLRSITLGNSVILIEESAFANCSRIERIDYIGLTSDWRSINKEDGWDIGTGSYIIYCTEGSIKKGAQ